MDYDDLYKILPKDPKKWKLDDVAIWLKFIGLPELENNFRQNSVDGSLLSTLDDSDLKEMDISESQIKIKKLVQCINLKFQGINVGFKEYSEYLKSKEQGQQIKSENVVVENFQDQSNSLIASNLYKKTAVQPEGLNDYITQQPQQQFELKETSIPKQERHLTLINITEKSQKVFSSKDDITIGRNPDSKIVLKEDYISRQHCKITYRESNQSFYLQDLGSSSGTYVQLVNPTLLKEGVILHMGLGQFLISSIKINGDKCSVFIRVLEGKMQNQNLDFVLLQDQTALIFGRQMSLFGEDTHLSSQHAQFTFIEEGLVIEDLDSRNGTWLRLSPPHKPSEPAKLIDGRRFRLAYEQFFDCQIN